MGRGERGPFCKSSPIGPARADLGEGVDVWLRGPPSHQLCMAQKACPVSLHCSCSFDTWKTTAVISPEKSKLWRPMVKPTDMTHG